MVHLDVVLIVSLLAPVTKSWTLLVQLDVLLCRNIKRQVGLTVNAVLVKSLLDFGVHYVVSQSS